MSEIAGIVLLLAIAFYGVCVFVLPVCVYMIHVNIVQCLKELRKVNVSIRKEQLFMDQERIDAAKYIFKEGDYIHTPSGQEAEICRLPQMPELCAVTLDNCVLSTSGQKGFEDAGYIKIGEK